MKLTFGYFCHKLAEHVLLPAVVFIPLLMVLNLQIDAMKWLSQFSEQVPKIECSGYHDRP